MSTTAPARVGDETTLFAELHPKLARQVRRLVRTARRTCRTRARSRSCSCCATGPPARACSRGCLRSQSAKRSSSINAAGANGGSLAREDGGELDPVDERADPELRLQTLAALAAITAADLTARQARIVALHAAGHTYESISEMLGLSARTVERQLLRARRSSVPRSPTKGG